MTFLKTNDLEVVSIGCGEGYLEGLLECRGVTICGVDLDTKKDPFAYENDRCFLKEGRLLISSSEIYAIKENF